MIENDKLDFGCSSAQTIAVMNTLFAFNTDLESDENFLLTVLRYDFPTMPSKTKKSVLRPIELPPTYVPDMIYRLA